MRLRGKEGAFLNDVLSVLLQEHYIPKGRRDHSHLAKDVPLDVVELILGDSDLPSPRGGKYEQIPGIPDD